MLALGAAQVSGANFNDPNYSPGEPPTFEGMDDETANEKARDVGKYVQDLRGDIDTSERDGDITSERASQLRTVVDQKVGEVHRNYADSRSKRGSKPGGGGSGHVPASPSGNAADAPASSSTEDGGTEGKPKAQHTPSPDGGDRDTSGPRQPSGETVPGGPGVQTGNALGVTSASVAGAYTLQKGSGGSRSGANRPGGSGQGAPLEGTAGNDVGVDISNSRQLRRLLTQATTGIPLGFQALLMALLFVVALLLVLMVRERRRAQHVQRVSQLDYLTGLANREGFDRMLGIEWRRAMRYGHTLGLVFIDLDDFKRFNDSNGHLAGDRLLREVAAVINSEARVSDYTARLGGDEFVILCPETDAQGLEALIRRLEAASVGLAVSLSIGFTHQMPTDTTAEDLVGRADAAMYQAKSERGTFPVPGGAGSRSNREI